MYSDNATNILVSNDAQLLTVPIGFKRADTSTPDSNNLVSKDKQ